jgi:hypothetical protein
MVKIFHLGTSFLRQLEYFSHYLNRPKEVGDGVKFNGIIRLTIGSFKALDGYFRHKVGVKSTNRVKTSNLPSSMAAEHTHV